MSSATPTPKRNYSILSIPIVHGLAFPPHLYYFVKGMTASGYAYSNMLPRTNLEVLKTKIPEATWQTLVRARGAHLNAFEGFPFFAGAMLAGNYAGLSTKELNTAAAEYIGARIVYTALYMTARTEAWSYVRSSVYFLGLAAPTWILWKAGMKIRDADVDKKDL